MAKILYITYDFNFKKTGSSRFFYDYLCENFEVDTISPDAENTIPYEQINEKDYTAIISFYFYADFSKIKCPNKIFVPMYDGFAFSFKKVQELQNVKVINFCLYFHKLCKLFGLKSFYIKYYPELEYQQTERDKLFYWQRRETSFSKISKCFSDNVADIGIKSTILHSATDGSQKFFPPTEEEKRKFNITITNWFENKDDLIKLLDQSKYYIAPRKQEGIGLSFLDAMSHGCVIIAHNDCTMNEYIQNGVNGYLVDFDNPQKIDFKDFDKIQKESIKRVEEGVQAYNEALIILKDFIKDENCKSNFLRSKMVSFLYFGLKKVFHKN